MKDRHVQKNDIRNWLEEGIKKGATHCIVMCDQWEYEDFPVYIMPGEDAKKKAKIYNQPYPCPQRLQEVYNLKMDIEKQLSEERSIHY